MADQDDVRRIALSLPGVTEATDTFAFSVRNRSKNTGLAWVWLERVHPKKGRIPNPAVLAVRVPHEADKEMLIAAQPRTYFTEPHYNGYPAILVRLEHIDPDELEELLTDGWRCLAPSDLVRELDEQGDSG